MPHTAKSYRFPISFGRFFVRTKDQDAYDLIHFKNIDEEGGMNPIRSCPDNWNVEVAAMLAEAFCPKIPAETTAVEENTVPSWLWRRVSTAARTTEETSVQQILDRVVGSAAYRGWKEGLFADEVSAQVFYDETRYALAQRFMAIHPRELNGLGVEWAYGVKENGVPHPIAYAQPHIEITNTIIDGIVSGSRDKAARSKWHKATGVKSETTLTDVHFADTAREWGTVVSCPMNAAFDIMAFRHNDGFVNIEALRHAVRLLVVLMDLHGIQPVLGFNNVSPLLMALTLPYDSDAARATVASISSIITAEATMVSAELAGLRGVSPNFTVNREPILRALRNHRRAAYGEVNDYEKISVLPVSLNLEVCPDLALAAAARSQWDDALQLAQHFGLRHVGLTTLTPSPELAFFMESVTPGLEPMHGLSITQMDGDTQTTLLHPSVTEALTRLEYDAAESRSIARHVVGAQTLDHAPHINLTSLRARGFDAGVLERVEEYVPQATSLRFVFTPWVLGEQFCRDVLNLSDSKLDNPRFDLLHHLGFTPDQIEVANIYCYGGTISGLHPRDMAIFATQAQLPPEARIRMAAAVQPHIVGDVGLHLCLNPAVPTEQVEKLVLAAWRQGVKSLAISYDDARPLVEARKSSADALAVLAKRKGQRQAQSSSFAHAHRAALPVRKVKDVQAKSTSMARAPTTPRHAGR